MQKGQTITISDIRFFSVKINNGTVPQIPDPTELSIKVK